MHCSLRERTKRDRPSQPFPAPELPGIGSIFQEFHRYVEVLSFSVFPGVSALETITFLSKRHVKILKRICKNERIVAVLSEKAQKASSFE